MTRFERWSVWLTTAGTLATGLLYWWMKDLMTSSDPWAVINHPLQPWVLKAHILVAPLLVFSVGLITMRHVWRHFRSGVRKGRRSGIAAASLFGVLVATGYLLQVITGETLLRLVGWTHLGLGVVYSLAVAAHWPATRGAAGVRDAPEALRAAPTPGREPWAHPGAEPGRTAPHERRHHGSGQRTGA